jgi:hypothetical protein
VTLLRAPFRSAPTDQQWLEKRGRHGKRHLPCCSTAIILLGTIGRQELAAMTLFSVRMTCAFRHAGGTGRSIFGDSKAIGDFESDEMSARSSIRRSSPWRSRSGEKQR